MEFDYDSDGGPTLDYRPSPLDCKLCVGGWPSPLACPDHQFALSEYQLSLLWRNWVPAMDPINPIEHEDDDGLDLPGSFAYYEHFRVIF